MTQSVCETSVQVLDMRGVLDARVLETYRRRAGLVQSIVSSGDLSAKLRYFVFGGICDWTLLVLLPTPSELRFLEQRKENLNGLVIVINRPSIVGKCFSTNSTSAARADATIRLG